MMVTANGCGSFFGVMSAFWKEIVVMAYNPEKMLKALKS
jgi:hypothetical protein